MKRSENRKALPKFLLTLLIAGVIGGFIGALIGQLDRQIFMKASANAAYVFGYYIVPWLMIIDAIVILVFCLTLYKQAKALYDSWDQEDDEIINRAEAKITVFSYAHKSVSSSALYFSHVFMHIIFN